MSIVSSHSGLLFSSGSFIGLDLGSSNRPDQLYGPVNIYVAFGMPIKPIEKHQGISDRRASRKQDFLIGSIHDPIKKGTVYYMLYTSQGLPRPSEVDIDYLTNFGLHTYQGLSMGWTPSRFGVTTRVPDYVTYFQQLQKAATSGRLAMQYQCDSSKFDTEHFRIYDFDAIPDVVLREWDGELVLN